MQPYKTVYYYVKIKKKGRNEGKENWKRREGTKTQEDAEEMGRKEDKGVRGKEGMVGRQFIESYQACKHPLPTFIII